MNAPAIVWFRRDLRLHDNLALGAALEAHKPIVPLFVLDPTLLNPHSAPPRLALMFEALRALDESLRAYGRRLLVRLGDPLAVIRAVADETGADALYFNVDYTPRARQRDAAVAAGCGLPVETFHDRLIVAPHEISTDSGNVYTVYTPFKNKWRALPKRHEQPLDYRLTAESFYDVSGLNCATIPQVDAGVPLPGVSESAGLDRLQAFVSRAVYHYAEKRDTLANPFDDARNGTSSLSPYIRFGLVSLRQVRAAAADAYQTTRSEAYRESVVKWVDEIIWHEFYTHVLWHFPHAASGNFNRKYDTVQWRETPDELSAWQHGQTGYPIVDAAMRQLNATGWMHNRARMIVASFLTKDLLIDWRAGERYFMQRLLDGDTAANNGGWQWSAGTGTDAQPYFRIFNPVSQSKKFDPDGVFIRHWLPELRAVPDKFIHEPWRAPTPPRDYPPPMVDHAMARERTLQAFASVKEHTKSQE